MSDIYLTVHRGYWEIKLLTLHIALIVEFSFYTQYRKCTVNVQYSKWFSFFDHKTILMINHLTKIAKEAKVVQGIPFKSREHCFRDLIWPFGVFTVDGWRHMFWARVPPPPCINTWNYCLDTRKQILFGYLQTSRSAAGIHISSKPPSVQTYSLNA